MTTIPFVDEIRLVALIQNPATMRQRWVENAACRKRSLAGDSYFPEDDEIPSANALAFCAGCPVAYECLATALIHEVSDGYRFGWWGGLRLADRDLLCTSLDRPRMPPAVEFALGDPAAGDPAAVARSLRNQNHTIPVIAAELGCSERTVYRYLAATAA